MSACGFVVLCGHGEGVLARFTQGLETRRLRRAHALLARLAGTEPPAPRR